MMEPRWIRVTTTDNVPPREGRAVQVGNREIALFNERNPNTEIAVFRLSPRNGRAVVGTRIRLATSQHLVAIARMSDGSLWRHAVDVIVTLAACIEG